MTLVQYCSACQVAKSGASLGTPEAPTRPSWSALAVVQSWQWSTGLKRRPPGAVLLASIPAGGIFGFFVRQLIRYPDLLLSLLLLNTYGYVKTPERAKAQFLGPDSTVEPVAFHQKLQRESLLIAVQTMFPFANRAKILQGKTPILVLAGEKDMIFTVEEEKKMAVHYGVPLQVFERQGHNLMIEPRSREIADVVDHWMTENLKLP